FNTSDGSLSQAGDVLVNADYTIGGSFLSGTMRVWVNPNDVDGKGHDLQFINSKANRPFTFTGVFTSGTATNGYGYAEVRANTASASSCLFFMTQNTTNIMAAPWGNLYGPQATFSTTIYPFQLVEIGINLTKLGLDLHPVSGPCFNLF